MTTVAAEATKNWTRPIVLLNALAFFGLLLSAALYLFGDLIAAYLLIFFTNAPEALYSMFLLRRVL